MVLCRGNRRIEYNLQVAAFRTSQAGLFATMQPEGCTLYGLLPDTHTSLSDAIVNACHPSQTDVSVNPTGGD